MAARVVSFVTIALLTPEEADRLRFEAMDVLRSAHRRRLCECEHPWRSEPGSPYCERCGKWLSKYSPEWLKNALVALDEIAEPHIPEPISRTEESKPRERLTVRAQRDLERRELEISRQTKRMAA